MSDTSITRAFPAGNPRGLDESVFQPLLRQAILAYVETLAKAAPEMHIRSVVDLDPEEGGGARLKDVPFPVYRSWDLDRARASLASSAMRQLLDYIWDQGEMPHSFTGPNPTRETWELSILHQLIHSPVLRALNLAAIDEAIDTGSVTVWRLPTDAIEKLLSQIVPGVCRKQPQYHALCQLMYLEGPSGVWELSDGIKLRFFTRRDVAVYLSRNMHVYASPELAAGLLIHPPAFLEIMRPVPPCPAPGSRRLRPLHEIVIEDLADCIDVIKWGIMVGSGQSIPVREGIVTYEGDYAAPEQLCISRFLHREESRSAFGYTVTPDELAQVSEVLRRGFAARETSDDLQQAFWYWGRSALAELERDKLLDASIGLEGLLVRSSGESTYRFALHGCALLARRSDNTEALAKELKEIYRQRSGAAHGKRGEGMEQAPVALRHLGDAISAVIDLADQGVLSLSDRIAAQIERLVLQGSPILSVGVAKNVCPDDQPAPSAAASPPTLNKIDEAPNVYGLR